MNEVDLTPEEEINRKRNALKERRRKQEASDLRSIMDTPEGRRVIMRLLEEGRAFHSCFDLNPIMMAKNEGKRDIALFILTELMRDHQTQYLQMCREAKTLKQNNAAELKTIIEGDENA